MRPTPTGSCQYRIDENLGLALVQVTGNANGAYIAWCVEALQSDSAWSFSYAALWDERWITSLDITLEDLDEMVEAQADGQIGPDVVVTAREDHEAVMGYGALCLAGPCARPPGNGVPDAR